MNVKDFFGKFVSTYLWGHLLAMVLVIVALSLGVWFGLDIYTHHGEEIEIPDLNHMNCDQARELLEDMGLCIEVNDSGYNKSIPANVVLAQLPAAGMKVKSGRTVYVTVNSLQSPRVAIPDLIDNSSYREAEARLKAMGFKMSEPKIIDGEKDWVYGIRAGGRNLQTGDQVSIESHLTLVIGRGMFVDEEEELLSDEDIPSMEDDDVDDFLEITEEPAGAE